jgi:hypothetical protein
MEAVTGAGLGARSWCCGVVQIYNAFVNERFRQRVIASILLLGNELLETISEHRCDR